MTPFQEVHLELLKGQVTSLFKYYNSLKCKRITMLAFLPHIENGKEVVRYTTGDPTPVTSTRLKIDIIVQAGGMEFIFRQTYNYGVPMHVDVEFAPTGDMDHDLIELEYAISIATEHTAFEISKLVK